MTDDSIALRELWEKGADAGLLCEIVGFAAKRPMEPEVQALTGAGYRERSPDRLVQRNGYRDRVWETRAGTRAATERNIALHRMARAEVRFVASDAASYIAGEVISANGGSYMD